MFAPDLGFLVQGPNIDQPYNGFLLSIELHKRFGILQLWFEATDQDNTYMLRQSKRSFPLLGSAGRFEQEDYFQEP